jgi:hypothetical protein
MHLGVTHTIRDQQLDNLYVYVLDNNCYESVGGQPCANLEENYPGIQEIVKIEPSEADPRIPLDWETIRSKIEDFLLSPLNSTDTR